ncbi:hypothetical protein AVEN_77551-1, partial [Araneus ventricosus]
SCSITQLGNHTLIKTDFVVSVGKRAISDDRLRTRTNYKLTCCFFPRTKCDLGVHTSTWEWARRPLIHHFTGVRSGNRVGLRPGPTNTSRRKFIWMRGSARWARNWLSLGNNSLDHLSEPKNRLGLPAHLGRHGQHTKISRRTAPECGRLIVNKERNYFSPVKFTHAPETARVQASVEWGGLRRDWTH